MARRQYQATAPFDFFERHPDSSSTNPVVLLIPQPLRSAAHIDNTALILGIGKDIEVWSPDFYHKMEESGEAPASAAALVSNFDLTL